MRKSKIFWGIVLIAAAVALILFAAVPSLTLGTSVPAWKIILCVLIFVDIIRKLVEERRLSGKLSIFIHLALIFIILKKNIAAWCSLPENFVNSWYIILASILLTIAVELIFSSKHVMGYHGSSSHKNALSESTVYIDISENDSYEVSNKFGSMKVYFQNTDVAGGSDEFTLYVSNKFGETVIHAPESFTVDMKIQTTFGEADSRPNTIPNGKKITVKGKNAFGEINVV